MIFGSSENLNREWVGDLDGDFNKSFLARVPTNLCFEPYKIGNINFMDLTDSEIVEFRLQHFKRLHGYTLMNNCGAVNSFFMHIPKKTGTSCN